MTRDDALRDLSDEARTVVVAYLESVQAVLAGVDDELACETLDGLAHHLSETLDSDSGADDARAAVDGLGTPELIAESLGVSPTPASAPAAVSAERPAQLGAGRVLGVPFDIRVPTADRVAHRWWNPGDRRLFVPRVFGLGWSLNFGAVAVRAGLVRPDDEDEPFGEVPSAWFAGLLTWPVAASCWIALSYVARRDSLPAELPSHWGLSGAPDAYSSASAAFGMLFALAFVPTAWAVFVSVSGRTPLSKGATLALASLMSTVAAGLWVLTLITADGSSAGWWAPGVVVVGALAVPFLQLVTLALIGRRAEIRRDLRRARKE